MAVTPSSWIRNWCNACRKSETTSASRYISPAATAYNARKDVGGAKFSQHQYGKAADVWIDGVSVDTLANYIDQSVLPNTGGIGRYYKDAAHPSRKQPFVHIDVRKARSRWLG